MVKDTRLSVLDTDEARKRTGFQRNVMFIARHEPNTLMEWLIRHTATIIEDLSSSQALTVSAFVAKLILTDVTQPIPSQNLFFTYALA